MMALGAEDRLLVARELTEIARTEPDAQDRVAEALQELMDDEAAGAEILRRLEELDPASVTPGLIVRITQHEKLKGPALALVGRWRDSERLPQVAAAAANELLGDHGPGA
jgi:hypothetical protein